MGTVTGNVRWKTCPETGNVQASCAGKRLTPLLSLLGPEQQRCHSHSSFSEQAPLSLTASFYRAWVGREGKGQERGRVPGQKARARRTLEGCPLTSRLSFRRGAREGHASQEVSDWATPGTWSSSPLVLCHGERRMRNVDAPERRVLIDIGRQGATCRHLPGGSVETSP